MIVFSSVSTVTLVPFECFNGLVSSTVQLSHGQLQGSLGQGMTRHSFLVTCPAHVCVCECLLMPYLAHLDEPYHCRKERFCLSLCFAEGIHKNALDPTVLTIVWRRVCAFHDVRLTLF